MPTALEKPMDCTQTDAESQTKQAKLFGACVAIRRESHRSGRFCLRLGACANLSGFKTEAIFSPHKL
jgi:hypothetical protein